MLNEDKYYKQIEEITTKSVRHCQIKQRRSTKYEYQMKANTTRPKQN